jgi:hypothetical protein
MCLGEEMRREIEALVRVVLPTFIDEILCATFRFLIVVRTSIEIELLSSPGSMNVHHIAEPGEDRSRENDEQISPRSAADQDGLLGIRWIDEYGNGRALGKWRKDSLSLFSGPTSDLAEANALSSI